MKRILSLLLSLLLLLATAVPCATAFADGTPVYDYYAQAGTHEVSSFTFSLKNGFSYKVWYPSDIQSMTKRPVLVYNNATGYTYENIEYVEEAMTLVATHGYIAIDNTDKRTGTGASMDAGFSQLIKFNADKNSPLYGKVDLYKTVLAGHSQGCGGCVNMADKAQYENAKYYKAIFCASIVTEETAANPINYVPYTPSTTTIPALMICGEGMLEKGICTPDTCLIPFKNKSKGDVYIAQIKGVDHLYTLSKSLPYALAWFDFQLYGKAFAAQAFTGAAPELKTNTNWQGYDRKIYVNKTSISKITAGKKSLTVTWKKAAYVTGYELQYSQYKSFKKKKSITFKSAKTVKKKLSKLAKKKRYYVRIRTYRVYDGKTLRSKWCSTKSKVTKK